MIATLVAAVQAADKRLPKAGDRVAEARARASDGKADAAYYREPNITAGMQCEKLIGREALVEDVTVALDHKHQVLLHGMAGAGKTVLAATIADRWIQAGKGTVVWLPSGNRNGDLLFEAMARCGDSEGYAGRAQELRSLTGYARQRAACEFLVDLKVSLLVLDDARDKQALREMLATVAQRIGLLVTSRTRFEVDEMREVGDLGPDDAMDLLGLKADKDFHTDPQAVELCRRLGYHAYAVEIAGSRLKADQPALTPKALLERIDLALGAMRTRAGNPRDARLLKSAPHAMSLELAEPGRESVGALLQDSFGEVGKRSKDRLTQRVLVAFGVLFATSATKDFLAAYVERDPIEVESSLHELVKRSLVKVEIRGADVDVYKVHDLTYSFVRVLAIERKLSDERLVAAAERYMSAHARDFELLHVDQPHILGAAGGADDLARIRIVAPLAMGGYPNALMPGYIDVHGHSRELLVQLDETIAACRNLGAEKNEVLHYLLSKRANAHLDRGETEEGMAQYQEALQLAPNPTRQVVLLAVMGREHARQGRNDQSQQMFERARQIATANDDYNGRMRALVQESWAASFAKDYVKVRDLAHEGIVISRQCGDPVREAYFQINYGSALLELLGTLEGDQRQESLISILNCHEMALEIATREHDDTLRANALYALGQDYVAFRDHATARPYLQQAHELFKQLGHTRLAKEVETFMQQLDQDSQTTVEPTDAGQR